MNSNLIYRGPKLYSKQSCKKLINFFDNNVSKATKGRYGDKKLNNLEITIDIVRSQDWFILGEALMKGINNYKKQCVYFLWSPLGEFIWESNKKKHIQFEKLFKK